MPRNHQKEAAWAKQKYQSFGMKIDKQLAEQLTKVLAQENITQSNWFKQVVKETIDKYTKPPTPILQEVLPPATILQEVETKPSKRILPSSPEFLELVKKWDVINKGDENNKGISFKDMPQLPEANGYKRASIHKYVQAYREGKYTIKEGEVQWLDR